MQLGTLKKTSTSDGEEFILTTERLTTEAIAEQKEALMERLHQSIAGTFEIFSIYIGDRLGFYQALAKDCLTVAELASQTNTHESYVQEWLEQQIVTGILEVEDETLEAGQRRFHLPAGHAQVLTDSSNLDYLAPLTQMLLGVTRTLNSPVDAYREWSMSNEQ